MTYLNILIKIYVYGIVINSYYYYLQAFDYYEYKNMSQVIY